MKTTWKLRLQSGAYLVSVLLVNATYDRNVLSEYTKGKLN